MKQSSDEHEHYLIELFCESCCSSLGFDYQKTKIKESESPDFVLCHSNHCIGIEITRALDQNLQKAEQIRNNEFKDVSYCPAVFEDKKQGSEEIKDELRKFSTKFTGIAYVDDGLEEKIVDNIIQAIERKIKKFDNYKKFEKNILLVHAENRATLGHDFVVSKLKGYVFRKDVKFDYIFLKLGDLFHSFSNDGEYTYTIKGITKHSSGRPPPPLS